MNLKIAKNYMKLHFKAFMRTKSGPFFMILFPVILMLLFGSIFGSSSLSKVTVAVENEGSWSQPVKNSLDAMNMSGLFTLQIIPAGENISKYMEQNSVDEGVLFPSNFTTDIANGSASVYYYENPTDAVASGLSQTIQNLMLIGTGSVSKNVYVQTVPIAGAFNKPVDYYLPALLGFTIINGIFAMVYQVPNYRKQKIFRQLSFANLTMGDFLLASLVFFVFVTFISDLILFLIGVFVFGINVSTGIFGLILAAAVIVSGLVIFISLGLIAAIFTKDEESANLIANIIFFPMIFLSGVFFPISLMPSYLQTVADVLPLTYFNKLLDKILIFNSTSGVFTELGIMLAAAALLFIGSSLLAGRIRGE